VTYFRHLLFAPVLVILCSGVVAAPEETELSAADARATVAGFIEAVSSYSAEFTQELRNDAGELLDEERGNFWLQRPGKFRWEYTEPSERLIVANTERVWLYDVELDQATVRSAAGALQQSPAALLVGDLSALDNYQVAAVTLDGYTVVTLRPVTGGGDFKYVELYFNADNLAQLDLYDSFHQHTTVRFNNAVSNPKLDAALFDFKVPDGVDVIDQTMPAANQAH
jgi:outer membrane lipoprotein carrier protein